MKFKSVVLAQASGAIGGQVASHNRFGQYFRNRTIPVNTNTPFQQAIRTAMAYLANAWTAVLTDAQRLAWTLYGDNVPVKDRLGNDIKLTGYNQYLRSNVPALQAGLSEVDDGPTTFSLPGSDPTLALTATDDAPYLSVAFDNSLEWANEAGGALLLFVSRPQSNTTNFFNGPWRYIGKVAGATPAPPESPATFASPWAQTAGQKVYLQARILRADGRLSNPFQVWDTVQ